MIFINGAGEGMTNSAIHEAIAMAVRKALAELGLDRFKETSFFISRAAAKKNKKAA